MFISRAPYRLSFYGGGLDYPQWFKKYTSKILCASLDKYCYMMIRKLPPFFDHKIRISYSNIELCNHVDEIVHPSVKGVLKYFKLTSGIEISHIGDLPARSGVGSSSSFTVSLVNGIAKMNNINFSKSEVAKIAIDIEQNIINENVGIQDQYAASIGGIILIKASKSGITHENLKISNEYKQYLESNLLIGFSGRSRFSSFKANKIVNIISKNEKEELMIELQDLSEKGIVAFQKQEDIYSHSKLTKRIRDIKMELNSDNDDPFLQNIISKTETAGSRCTRFIGAGGGGFFLCWAPESCHNQIKESVSMKTWLNVRFSFDGCSVFSSDYPNHVI